MSTTEVSVPPPCADLVTGSTLSVTVDDPPPPYPSRERRSRTTRYQRRHRLPTPSDPDLSHSTGSVAPHFLVQAHPFPRTEDITEHTPLLSDALPGSTPRSSGHPRSYSQSSTIISSTSCAPSLAQTILSLLQFEPADESDDVDIYEVLADGRDDTFAHDSRQSQHSGAPTESRSGRWSRYFRPMTRRAYHAAVFHLLVLNFPYALIAWVYLFVFTVVSALCSIRCSIRFSAF